MHIIPSFTVKMDLFDVLYLSYLAPVERLKPMVPGNLPFALTTGGKTIFSVVIFHSKHVSASLLPFIHFAYDQANIRTYVRDPATGKPAVLFLKSGITSRLVAGAAGLMGIPWQPVSVTVDAEYAGHTLRRYDVDGLWGESFHIRLREGGDHTRVGPFEDPHEAVRFITGPGVGLYGRLTGLVRFEVRHSVVEPLAGAISRIEFPLLESLGLLKREELSTPLHAIVAPHAHFTIFMPPAIIPLNKQKEKPWNGSL
jgi:hypothetical protein